MELSFKNWHHWLILTCLLGSFSPVTTGCNKSSLKDLALFRPSQPEDEPSFANLAGNSEADSLTLTVWHDSFDAALEASAQSGKPILADFTGSDWCGWCVKLKKDVFETSEFKQWARDNVILLELDYPKRSSQPVAIKRQNAELKSRYNISGYPTVLLLNSDGEPIGRKLGYMDDPTNWVAAAESQIGQFRVARRAEQE